MFPYGWCEQFSETSLLFILIWPQDKYQYCPLFIYDVENMTSFVSWHKVDGHFQRAIVRRCILGPVHLMPSCHAISTDIGIVYEAGI